MEIDFVLYGVIAIMIVVAFVLVEAECRNTKRLLHWKFVELPKLELEARERQIERRIALYKEIHGKNISPQEINDLEIKYALRQGSCC